MTVRSAGKQFTMKQSTYRPVLLGVCFAAGGVIGVVGTALHGNILMLGSTDSGFVVPWGAVLALVILLLAQLWAGMTSGSLVEPLLMGATAFTVATAAYVWPGPDQLVVHYSALAWETLPGPVIASALWWMGSAVVTMVAMILVRLILIKDAALQRRIAQNPPTAQR